MVLVTVIAFALSMRGITILVVVISAYLRTPRVDPTTPCTRCCEPCDTQQCQIPHPPHLGGVVSVVK